jgi:tetraacyldisaccharide 4'-kinase
MSFNNNFLKSFRVLLLPLAILFGLIIRLRNYLYEKNIFKSVQFNFPVICVGNLSLGGTGKSPMVEHILSITADSFQMATLSRGYKRKTKGYALADVNTTALEIGDEPMQFHVKFPNVAIAVGERRIEAIPQLIQDIPNIQAILLDDAFQHREIKAGFNILLTDYHNLYCDDIFFPTGDLRDERAAAKRADVIVVTKCPKFLTTSERDEIIEKLFPQQHQSIYFSSIAYGTPYHIYNSNDEWILNSNDEVLLVCGIANPLPLKAYLNENVHTYYQLGYNDHHIFSFDDLNEIKEKFNQIKSNRKLIITTEKDAVRLIKYADFLNNIPLYILPIKPHFLFNMEHQFNHMIIDYIQQHHATKNGI